MSELDLKALMQDARNVAWHKTQQQFPFPHQMIEKRQYFAREAARQFCDRVLVGGYASLSDMPRTDDAAGEQNND